MTPEEMVRELHTADGGLRRFATHLAPGRADEALRRAYSTAIGDQASPLEGGRPSLRMFWEVRASSLALRTTALAAAATDSDLATALHALPVNERAALLLVGVEGLTVADAASVLGVAPERVVDLADTAAASLRDRVPAVASYDDPTLVAAIRDLPIAPASPPFWDAVEREAVAAAAEQQPRRISPWVWVGVAAAAFAAIVGLAVVLSSGDDGDETVAIVTSTSVIAPTSTTVPLTSTTAPPDTGVTTTTAESATTTVAPTTTAAQTTTTTPPDDGPVDRGDVPFDDGAASLSGTLDGRPEVWRLTIGGDQSLVMPTQLPGVQLLVLDADGGQVAADGSTDRLQVFESPGDRLVQLTPSGGESTEYALGLGLGSDGSGWLSVAPEEGTAAAELTPLTTVECVATSDGLDAELEDAGDSDQRVVVASGTDSGTVTWTGPVEASGTITSTTSTANVVVVDGTIESGPDELAGRGFGLAIVGCDEG